MQVFQNRKQFWNLYALSLLLQYTQPVTSFHVHNFADTSNFLSPLVPLQNSCDTNLSQDDSRNILSPCCFRCSALGEVIWLAWLTCLDSVSLGHTSQPPSHLADHWFTDFSLSLNVFWFPPMNPLKVTWLSPRLQTQKWMPTSGLTYELHSCEGSLRLWLWRGVWVFIAFHPRNG